MKFIHLSDLHIHKSMEKEENQNFKIVRDYIIKKHAGDNEKPLIMITGDIVDDGDKKQYKNAVKLLRPLTEHFKALACPGNHDYGPCGNFYTEKSQSYFKRYILGDLLGKADAEDPSKTMEKIYPTQDIVGDVLFIGVDSVVGKEDELGHFASGEVGDAQRKKLAEILKKNGPTNKKAVVYFHHHPFDYNRGVEKPFMAMADADKVLRILATQTEFVCFGHRHKTGVYSPENVTLSFSLTRTSQNQKRFLILLPR